MQPAASQNCLWSNQNLIPHAQEWAENLSFSLIRDAFYLHLNCTSLLGFCLGKQKWMQSQHVGNSRNESLNNTPILEKELVRGNSPQRVPVHQQYVIYWQWETSGCCEPASELHRSNTQSQGTIWTQSGSTSRTGSATCAVIWLAPECYGSSGLDAVGLQKRQIVNIVSSLPH